MINLDKVKSAGSCPKGVRWFEENFGKDGEYIDSDESLRDAIENGGILHWGEAVNLGLCRNKVSNFLSRGLIYEEIWLQNLVFLKSIISDLKNCDMDIDKSTCLNLEIRSSRIGNLCISQSAVHESKVHHCVIENLYLTANQGDMDFRFCKIMSLNISQGGGSALSFWDCKIGPCPEIEGILCAGFIECSMSSKTREYLLENRAVLSNCIDIGSGKAFE